jgi:glutamate-1-semialdehyde 2,1-aminomutase
MKKNKKFKIGKKTYSKAKKIILNGNMQISKNPEQFLGNNWPNYFLKTKGCDVWDLDGNKFHDLSLMGVGTNILGYSNKTIDNAVKNVVRDGNMSTLNCKEEVYLAEKLIEMHPWAKMVKFARTGGEANSIAIRIARAASGRDNVAFCGYHGWHDWYLATNINNKKNLNNHLLKGISTLGVPAGLKGSIFPFTYNDFEGLESIIKKNKIGVICMEVMRNIPPKDNFLKKVRKIADKNNIVLIFDECTSGFRKNFGGLHLHFNVKPDLALFGKALGNGYAITAVIGKKSVMETAQKCFISSTFWTERIGPTAALATLKTMKEKKSWKIIDKNGDYIIQNWKRLASEHNLPIEIFGLPSMCSFNFKLKNFLKYKTLITQEMLKKGFLASNIIYSSISHSKKILEKYFYELDKIFKIIQKCEDGLDVKKLLKSKNKSSNFQRLN